MGELRLTFPLGLNNQARETDVPDGALRVCRNLDVATAGNLIARRGLRLVASGVTHSFYPHPHGYYALLAQDNQLVRLDTNGTRTVLAPLSSTRWISYAHLNGDIYWTNGADARRVTEDGTLAYWGLPTPASPVATAVAGVGGLAAGQYQVTWTARVAGIESGAPTPAVVQVEAGGGVQITVPAGAEFVIYLSSADGGAESLRQAAIDATGATLTLGQGNRGKIVESLYAIKPRAGQLLTTYRGRLYIADGSIVWITDSRSPHWLFPRTGYLLFDAPVDMLAPAEDGVYIAAGDKTYYLQGRDPLDATLRTVLSHGAVRYTQQPDIPLDLFLGPGIFPSLSAAWVDSQGAVCLGRPGGIVQRLTAKAYLASRAAVGHLVSARRGGIRQLVAALSETDSALQADDVSVGQVFEVEHHNRLTADGDNRITADGDNRVSI